MTPVIDRPEVVAAWVAERIQDCSDFGPYTAIGFAQDRVLIAGIVYNNYRPELGSVEVSFATNGQVRAFKDGLSVALSFPFIELRCQRVEARCRKKNKRIRRFLEGIGFKLEGCLRRGWGNEDMMVYGMLREDATRWLEVKHGSA